MGVRDVLPILASDGGGSATDERTHVECRDCGTNLAADAERCPNCGGDVAVYDLS
jgi:ribosomal protein L37E